MMTGSRYGGCFLVSRAPCFGWSRHEAERGNKWWWSSVETSRYEDGVCGNSPVITMTLAGQWKLMVCCLGCPDLPLRDNGDRSVWLPYCIPGLISMVAFSLAMRSVAPWWIICLVYAWCTARVDLTSGPYELTSFLVAATPRRGSMLLFSFLFFHLSRHSVGLAIC